MVDFKFRLFSLWDESSPRPHHFKCEDCGMTSPFVNGRICWNCEEKKYSWDHVGGIIVIHD